MIAKTSDLLPSSAPELQLLQATPEEKLATWHLNGKMWSGRLSLEAYIRREEHLGNQPITRHGGITYWVLVDGRKPPNQREILSSCETLRKRALIARAETNGAGDVEEVVSHGIGSVFTDPQYRGKGYATRMLQELGQKLNTWQQPSGRRSDFTVLYSDIGKTFYARSGWNSFPSSHIVLPAVDEALVNDGPRLHFLTAEELPKICAVDEAEIIKRGLVQQSSRPGKTMVALIPDKESMQWHHAREEFFANELLEKIPDVKGAYVHCADGTKSWCIWSRFFATDKEGDTLHILRFAIEGQEQLASVDFATANPDDINGPGDRKLTELASLLRAAQQEAFKWNMKEVHLWNPTPWAFQAAKEVDPSVELVHRDEESITSLRWHGSQEANKVEWLGNEKFGWC